jgi:hypothetical protein
MIMQKKLNVVTALLLVLMSLTTSSCATSGVKETKLVVLEIKPHYDDVKLNLTYHQDRSCGMLESCPDYSARFALGVPLESR